MLEKCEMPILLMTVMGDGDGGGSAVLRADGTGGSGVWMFQLTTSVDTALDGGDDPDKGRPITLRSSCSSN